MDTKQTDVSRRVWRPLQIWETRLLILHPGKNGDPLKGDLETAVITHEEGFGVASTRGNRMEQYEALSYAWGDTTLSQSLICNGSTIGITKNLCEALRHLRFEDKRRNLWIDALCINQNDDEEKSRQIGILRVIFAKAAQVIAWVGKYDRWSSNIAFETFDTPSDQQIDDDPDREENTSEFGDEDDDQDFWQLKADLYRTQRPSRLRAWFRRAWVVQECVAARRLILQCGFVQQDWDDFSVQCIEYHRAIGFLRDVIVANKGGTRVRVASAETARELYELLKNTRHLEATDDRDRIFALVGLTGVPVVYGQHQGDTKDSININYAKKTGQVYAEVSLFLNYWLRKSNLPLLADPGLPDVPSWSFDFRATSFPELLPADFSQADRDTAFISQPAIRSKRQADSPWQVLLVAGIQIGTISNVFHTDQEATSSHVLVQLSPFLKAAILDEYMEKERWRDLTADATSRVLLWPQGREELRRTVKKELHGVRKNRHALPPGTLAKHLRRISAWATTGNPAPDDIIVYANGALYPSILRQRPSGGHCFIGSAVPSEHLEPGKESERPRQHPFTCLRIILYNYVWATNLVHHPQEVTWEVY